MCALGRLALVQAAANVGALLIQTAKSWLAMLGTGARVQSAQVPDGRSSHLHHALPLLGLLTGQEGWHLQHRGTAARSDHREDQEQEHELVSAANGGGEECCVTEQGSNMGMRQPHASRGICRVAAA